MFVLDVQNIINDGVNALAGQMEHWFDATFPCAGFSDTKETMLLMAYVQLLTPLLSIIFNCICNHRNKDDNDQRAGGGVGLTGIVSMASGSLYMAFYYKARLQII